jgi:hypothetical protein
MGDLPESLRALFGMRKVKKDSLLVMQLTKRNAKRRYQQTVVSVCPRTNNSQPSFQEASKGEKV